MCRNPGSRRRQPLTLRAAQRPVLGNTVDYTTSNEPTLGVGVNFISLADLGALSPAGLDLVVMGAPGCVANVDIHLGSGNLISNLAAAGMIVARAIPINPWFVGRIFYSQSIWLGPVANAIGQISSSAVRSTTGTF